MGPLVLTGKSYSFLVVLIAGVVFSVCSPSVLINVITDNFCHCTCLPFWSFKTAQWCRWCFHGVVDVARAFFIFLLFLKNFL